MDKKLKLIKDSIRTIPNFPKTGIMFRDITTLLNDNEAFQSTIDLLYDRYIKMDIDCIAGIESRGFIFGAALAYKLNLPFVTIRKKGKLPGKVISEEYDLEYGTDIIEIHEDAITKDSNVLVIDDLIATGGTAIAACKLIKKAGGNIKECCFVVDLPELNGTKKLKENEIKVFSLIDFEGE